MLDRGMSSANSYSGDSCVTLSFRAIAIAMVLLMTLSSNPLHAQSKPLTAEQQQVVDTVGAIFAAAETDDLAKFHSVTAPSFYIYDNGARFDGDTIMNLIKKQHEAGKRYVWNVTDPDVHISGSNAWVAYVNRGSITDASGTQEMQWLESAVLKKLQGRWKIEFMQSTRVPPSAAK
jgi:hypothetical protein